MDITLEQIELVKDRTGASYKEAKEALEYSNGNVVDAIIYIEENISFDAKKSAEKTNAEKIVEVIKNAIRTGNVTKIKVYKNEEIVLNIPVTIGTVATIVFPWGMVAAAVATAATGCRVELIKEDGSVINVNEKAEAAYGTVKEKGGVILDELKTKGGEVYETVKEKGGEVYETVKEKSSEVYETVKAKGEDLYCEAMNKGSKVYNDAVDKGTKLYNDAVEKGTEVYENTKDKINDYFEKDQAAEESSVDSNVDCSACDDSDK